MSFPLVALGELCEIQIGKTPSRAEPGFWRDGNLPWLSIADMNQGRSLRSTKECITSAGAKAANMKVVEPGTLLLSYKLSIGKVGIAEIPLYTNEAIAALSCLRADVDIAYMYWALRHIDLSQGADRAAMGSTLNKAKLKNIRFPIPNLVEQRRIAAILDKADALRTQRRAAIAKLDELVQSVFIEMFGDPVMNPKGWVIGSLSAYGSFKNGLNFGKDESGVNIRYVGVGDFKSKAALKDFGKLAFVELNRLPAEDYFLHDGDLLFVRSNGNRELVGRCMAVYPGMEKVTYSGFCIRYRIADVSLQSTYVAHLFRSVPFRRLIFQGGQGANIQNINQQILSDLPIPIPDEGLQSQFATIVEKIGAQKQIMQRAAEKSDAFFTSLQHLAFSGKL